MNTNNTTSGISTKQPLRRWTKSTRQAGVVSSSNTTTTTSNNTGISYFDGSTSTSTSPRYFDTINNNNNNNSNNNNGGRFSFLWMMLLSSRSQPQSQQQVSTSTKNAIISASTVLFLTTGVGLLLWYIIIPFVIFMISSLYYTILASIISSSSSTQDGIFSITYNETSGNTDNNNNGTIIQKTITFFETTLDTLPTMGGVATIELWPDHHYHTDYHRNDDTAAAAAAAIAISASSSGNQKQVSTNNSNNNNNNTIIEERMMDLYLYDCLPYENSDCQERLQNWVNNGQKQTTTIAILRSPGIIGEVVEEFVIDAISQAQHKQQQNGNIDNKITIVKTSHIDPDDAGHEVYTRIIRPSVMPLLLEATDLALRATGDDYHPTNITLDDIIGTVRQLIRWHKRIVYSAGKDTALLSIQFNRLIAYPKETTKQLLKFMKLPSISSSNNKDTIHHNKLMDKLAEKVIERVDTCNALLMRILRETTTTTTTDSTKQYQYFHHNKQHYNQQHHTTSSKNNNYRTNYYKIHQLVDDVVQEEGQILGTLMGDGSKTNTNNNDASAADAALANEIVNQPLRGKPIIQSRVTELVGHFLDRTTKMSDKICRTYPTSLMCLSDTSGMVHHIH